MPVWAYTLASHIDVAKLYKLSLVDTRFENINDVDYADVFLFIASPGLDEIRWHAPTRPGDRLRVRVTVTGVEVSKSKPDRGIVRDLVELHNQHDELVLSYRSMGMYYRAPEVIAAG